MCSCDIAVKGNLRRAYRVLTCYITIRGNLRRAYRVLTCDSGVCMCISRRVVCPKGEPQTCISSFNVLYY
jgi:hypothetical protein